MKLPRLATIQQPQAIRFDLDFVQIHHAGGAEVLLDPRVLDGVGIDAKQPLGQVAEGAVRGLLGLQNVLHLLLGQHALLHKQLSNRNPWQSVSFVVTTTDIGSIR